MIKPVAGCGNKNKAEALYLLKGHEPRHRKKSDAGSSAAWERENYPPVEPISNKKWSESMRRVQERALLSTFRTDEQINVAEGMVVPSSKRSVKDDLQRFVRLQRLNDLAELVLKLLHRNALHFVLTLIPISSECYSMC